MTNHLKPSGFIEGHDWPISKMQCSEPTVCEHSLNASCVVSGQKNSVQVD